MNPEIKSICIQFDEEGAWEFPKNFDYGVLEKDAMEVNRRINAELSEPTTFEDAGHNQDASFSISISLSGHKKETGNVVYLPCIRFSNFGRLVTICMRELLSEQLVNSIRRITAEKQFKYLPEDELDEPYDGVMASHENAAQTWWIRYFDWL